MNLRWLGRRRLPVPVTSLAGLLPRSGPSFSSSAGASSGAAPGVEVARPASAVAGIPASRVALNARITKHGRAGDLRLAQAVFDRMPHRDVISWTALLTAYAENGETGTARELFEKMPKRNTGSWNAMITAYARELRIGEATELFGKMPSRNAVSYGTMISGFVRAEMWQEAEKLYVETPSRLRDPVASNALISGYLRKGNLDKAIRIFDGMLTRDVISWSSVVDGYCKAGSIEEARKLFEIMPQRNVVTWTAMIRGYMKAGLWEDGFLSFLVMRRDGISVNTITLSVILDGCSLLAKFHEGLQMHALILSMGFGCDVYLGNSLISMYLEFNSMDDAELVFDRMDRRDVVSWNSMLNGYVQNDRIDEAQMLFEQMPLRDVVSWTSMLVGFASRGRLEESLRCFQEMPKKDDVAWTAMISGYVNNEEYEDAFHFFIWMRQEGIRLNPLAMSCILSASASLAILNQGMQIHACVVKMHMESEISVQNSLVSMYAKCGNLVDAYRIFLSIGDPNVVSMNTMITAFAQHGLAEAALEVFRKFKMYGYKPNHVTFLGVLSACCHAGMVEEGYRHFKSMDSYFGIEPNRDHYTCMVDLLGRAGLLKEAIELVALLPFDPHSAVWGALLGASKMHFDLRIAKHAAGHIFELDPENAIAYAVLSEMYALAGLRKDEDDVRAAKRLRGVRKNPGCSWIAVNGRVSVFSSGDKSHHDWNKISVVLDIISREIEVNEL